MARGKVEVIDLWSEYLEKDNLELFLEKFKVHKKQQGIRVNLALLMIIRDDMHQLNMMLEEEGRKRLTLGEYMELLLAKASNVSINKEGEYYKKSNKRSIKNYLDGDYNNLEVKE